jgi:hypothetical protein
MQVYTVNFYDWHGHAFRAGGHWWLAPRQISDHLELSWPRQQRKINRSNLKAGTALRAVPASILDASGTALRAVPHARKEQLMLTMKMGHAGAWLLGIEPLNVPEPKRARLIAMQEALLDALERQLAQVFGLPGLAEAEDLRSLPLPPFALSQMEPDACRRAREAVLADRTAFQATQLLRIGLPATKVAPMVRRSIYWTRAQQRSSRRIGLVPLTPRDQRLLEQPSLFGEG